MIMLYVNKDSFMSSFPIYISFICLIYSISKDFQCTVLKEWWGTNPCLVLSGKTLSFSPLNMTLAVAFVFVHSLCQVTKFLYIPSLLRGFTINMYWFSSEGFSSAIDIIMLMIFIFIFFSLLTWWITLVDWTTLHAWIKSYLVMVEFL